MNSDPYDSAAWRTFGMLDADESAIFDEAMRHDPILRSAYLEMDRLSAAIAAASTTPIEPKAGQLERLQNRLNLNPSRRAYLWLAISGWAAAAVLALLLVLNRNSAPGPSTAETSTLQSPETTAPAPNATPENPLASVATNVANSPPGKDQSAGSPGTANPESTTEQDGKTAIKVETKRLVQEIEVLRDNLEKFQQRDRVLFEPVPGMALPIVMRMTPPGLGKDETLALEKTDDHHSPITAMLGDALRGMTATNIGTQDLNSKALAQPDATQAPVQPTAIPIYDAARDSGTLVVSNLPPAETGKVYNLWVTTSTGAQPIYVGSLPDSSASGADSFDFSLGSNMVLPSGFVLTKDPLDSPANPTENNTVLEGPPTPTR
jgi:hypothetical protein